MTKRVIAICGGIGAGKSIISMILRNLGYSVYDCDAHAKLLMDNNDIIKSEIASKICPDVISNGEINRPLLSKFVFNNHDALNTLNQIVHSAVKNDINIWLKQSTTTQISFIETAILYQSGLDKVVTEVWEVIAPKELRIERVLHRNNISRADVEIRINAQNFTPQQKHQLTKEIINDKTTAVFPQILKLLQ